MPLQAASGALRIHGQMWNNSYVAFMSARGEGGGADILKNILGMHDGRHCWCGCRECAGTQQREVHTDAQREKSLKMKTQMNVLEDTSHFSFQHICNRTKM